MAKANQWFKDSIDRDDKKVLFTYHSHMGMYKIPVEDRYAFFKWLNKGNVIGYGKRKWVNAKLYKVYQNWKQYNN